jgi:ribosomal protein S18 acetylase RimI-like enzyme
LASWYQKNWLAWEGNEKLKLIKIIDNTTLVRPATGKDITRLASLTYRDEKWVKIFFDQLTKKSYFRIIEQDGKQLGFIHFRIIKRGTHIADNGLKSIVKRYFGLRGNSPDTMIQPIRYGLILETIIQPSKNQQNVAGILIEDCIDFLRSQQVSEIQVEICSQKEEAIIFYKSLGFHNSRLVMQKRLPKRLPPTKEYIRFANQNDFPQLINLVREEIMLQQSLADSFELIPDLNWPRIVSSKMNNHNTVLLVADQNDQIIGYLEAKIHWRGVHGLRSYFCSLERKIISSETRKYTPLGVIEDIYITPEERKQGFAQDLVLGGENWFCSLGLEKIQASIWAINEPSQILFHAVGYKPIKVILSKRI